MFVLAEVLWLLLAVLAVLAVGVGVVLLRAGRREGGTTTVPTTLHSDGIPTMAAQPTPGPEHTPEATGGGVAAPAPEPSTVPVPGALPASETLPVSETHSTTDPAGYALFRMNFEERARLLAAASGLVPADPDAADRSGPGAPDPARTGLIRGYVRDSSGGVVSGASLTLIDGSGQIGLVVAGGDGSYSMLTPGPGSYFLIARAKGHQPMASTVTIADKPVTLKIVLTGMAQLSGVVRLVGSQEPVPDAILTLLDPRGEVVATTVADPQGRYRFSDLIGDMYTLAASAPPFQPTADLVTVAESGTSRHDVELVAGAVLHGTARGGRERRILPDARVTLLDQTGNVAAVTRTDAAGEYLFSDVPEGSYTISASGYPPVTANIEIHSGRRHEHDVELGHPDD